MFFEPKRGRRPSESSNTHRARRGRAASVATIPIDKVPASLIEVAKKEVPGLKLENAYVFESGGKKIYEIRGTNAKGKLIEVEVDETGKVVAVE